MQKFKPIPTKWASPEMVGGRPKLNSTKKDRRLRQRFERTYYCPPEKVDLHAYSWRLGINTHRLRRRHRLTQTELAAKLNLPQTYVSNIESGWANPTLHGLVKLSHFFEVTVGQLVTRGDLLSQPFMKKGSYNPYKEIY